MTSAGEITVNAAYALGGKDPQEVLAKIDPTATVFVGVIVSERFTPKMVRQLDDAAAEIVATTGFKMIGGGRGKASGPASGPRSSERSTSRRGARARRR